MRDGYKNVVLTYCTNSFFEGSSRTPNNVLQVKAYGSEAPYAFTVDGKADRKNTEITPFPQVDCAVFSSRVMMS